MLRQFGARLLALMVLLFPGVAGIHAEQAAPLRILFVGNSLTYYNDLPGLVQQLAAADGDHSRLVAVDMLAAAGASIAQHLEAGHLQRYLGSEEFHVVVFQDMGGWPLCPPDFPGCAESVPSIEQVVMLIRASGAEPLWFSSYQPIPALQAALSEQAREISSRLNIRLADVGAAWTMHEAATDEGSIFLDSGHPNLEGSLLAAATILNAMGLPIIEPGEAATEVCFRRWQGSGISASQMASTQHLAKRECAQVSAERMQAITESARASFVELDPVSGRL